MVSVENSRPPASPHGIPASPEGVKRPLGFGYQGKDPSSLSQVASDPAVVKTLCDYFGFSNFRAGQQAVIEAALAGQDTAVFWATGSGKSICYQLPALHLGRTVVVVSPLISLMLDQVTKFNATAGAAPGAPRACFLGSAQNDPSVEGDAMRGLYQLVYVTPEKLGTSLLDRLKVLHAEGGLALLAVDEAHCISEWGHDFRPAYRQIKNVREVIPGLPIMSLTATAVPRVQNDILKQLGMTNPVVSKNSVDRPNLRLVCTRKQNKQADLARIAKLVAEGGSTIVYVPTQSETDMVAMFLSENLRALGVEVRSYHGGKYGPDREAAHFDFLSGRAQVIVATVAFGMGIDKPDIRRIVHYGPPKTVEEYFQQIGRAGRDGLSSSCELIGNDTDFNSYASDFYTKGLTPEGKEVQLKSTEALRSFAAACSCRRRWLLEYFGETPQFGDRCGTCDVCTTSAAHVGDLTRDFRQPASVVFEAVAATEDFPQAVSTLLAIMTGTWKSKYPNGASDKRKVDAVERIKRIKGSMPPLMRRGAFMREMITTLCNTGYLERQRKSVQVAGSTYTNNFEVYVRTPKGKDATGGHMEVRLPVPQELRQQEEEDKKRIEARKAELVKSGVDLKKIPVKELEQGEGKTIDATLEWTRRLNHIREGGNVEKARRYDELRSRILSWRNDVASKLRMAPGAVLGEDLVFKLAYSQPTSADALRGAGVRIVNVDELAALMQASANELFPKALSDPISANGNSDETGGSPPGNAPMVLPDVLWQAATKWMNAVYKPGRGGKLPAWEEYYNRWAKGEHPQGIAMNPPSGKAVQVNTVFSHILTALTFGKPVNLSLLAQQCEFSPPLEDEWRRMEEAAAVRNVDVNAVDYVGKEVLCGILGPENVNMEYADKSEESKALEQQWRQRMKWWESLRRVNFPVKFDSASGDAKRQRVS